MCIRAYSTTFSLNAHMAFQVIVCVGGLGVRQIWLFVPLLIKIKTLLGSWVSGTKSICLECHLEGAWYLGCFYLRYVGGFLVGVKRFKAWEALMVQNSLVINSLPLLWLRMRTLYIRYKFFLVTISLLKVGLSNKVYSDRIELCTY